MSEPPRNHAGRVGGQRHYETLRFQMRAAFRPNIFALISGVSFG
jgi:hypothetical protein